MEKTVITFSKEKETKRTFRFSEDVRKGQPAVCNTLYVQKHLEPADKIKVTIEPVT